jgi:chromosomal replication initiation ATPase DnaA
MLNLLRESGTFLMLTASEPPDAWGLKKADLLSRLRLAPIARLGEPDESLSRAVLVKLFHDRQLIVEPSVVDFVALRIERSLAAARTVVAALDREALARGRAVTRPMAAALLKDTAESD